MHVASSARICFTYHPSQDFFLRQVSLPWVPEVFSPVWRGASSAAGRHVFGLWQKTRAAKPETAHEKPLAPRVKFPLQEFFLGELSPGNAIGLTAQYLPWRGGEMSSFEIIPTHAFNFFVKYAIFDSGNSFIMTIIFPWSKILFMRNFTLSRFCFKLFRRAMRNNH